MAGLFLSRLAGEIWSQFTFSALDWPAVGVITILSLGISRAVFRRYTWQSIWPALLLSGYIFYPEADLRVAGGVMGLTLTAVLLSHRPHPLHTIQLSPLIVNFMPAVGFLGLYIATLSPDVLPADNGEFQWIATELGIAHPPGFTLYTLFGYLASRLPIGPTPAFRVNLLSAFTSAATLFVVFQIVFRLKQRTVAAITAVIALGTATTFWAQATMANIRSLTGLFAAVFLWSVIEVGRATTTDKSDRYLSFAALALGFGITHHPSLLFMGIVGILYLFWVQPSLIHAPRRWIRPFFFGISGFLPLLYLPLRAGSGAPGASPRLATINGFLDHVLARGFSGDFFFFITPGVLWERFRVMGNVMTFQFNPWLLVGMSIGLVILLVTNKKLAFLLGGSTLLHTFITATYRAPQSVEYMLPAYIPAVLLLGLGTAYLLNRLPEKMSDAGGKQQIAGGLMTVGTAILFIAAIVQGISNYPSFAQLHQSNDTRQYAETILNNAPANSLVLADWHWYTPLRYLQSVENRRPDLSIKFVPPDEGAYADTWANRIDEALENGRSVIATHFEENAYARLPIAEPIGEAYLFRQQPLQTVPDGFMAANIPLAEIQVLGYHLAPNRIPIGHEATLTIAWTSDREESISLFAHLIGFDGRLYGQDDLIVQAQPGGISLTQFRLTPRLGAAPGDLAVWIGSGDVRVQITTLAVTAMPDAPVTQQAVYYRIGGERPSRHLVGYDWDHTLPDHTRLYLHWQTKQGYLTETIDDTLPAQLPSLSYLGPWGLAQTLWPDVKYVPNQHYVPLGQGLVWMDGSLDAEARIEKEATIVLRPRLTSSRPVYRDLTISVRLIGYQEESDLWAWWHLNDSIPAMGAIPTLKWIRGSQIRSPHFLEIETQAIPGQQIGATLRMYDAFTNRPLPILDERILAINPWVPLGNNQLH